MPTLEKYYEFFENLNDSVFIADAKTGKILNANLAAEKLLGRSKSEIIGMNRIDFHPKEKKEFYENHFRNHVKQENVSNSEAEIQRKDGKIIPVSINASVLEIENKKIIMGVFRDISKLKQAEKALKESQQKYIDVVENTKESIIVTQDGKIKFANNAASLISKYPKEKLLSTQFTDFVHPDDCKKVMTHHLQRISGKELPYPYEFRFIDASGNAHWLRNSGVVIQWENAPATLNFLSDITKEKKNEIEKEELRKRINEYAKKLEHRINALERKRVSLNFKEKLVLWGIVRYPTATDEELSVKIKLKRSTITAIRNRLKSNLIYKTAVMPEFASLGAETFSVVYGKFSALNKDSSKLNRPRYDILLASKNEFMGLVTSKKEEDFRKIYGKHIEWCLNNNALKECTEIHLRLEHSRVYKMIDFSYILKDSFGINVLDEEIKEKTFSGKVNLTNNEKKVLLAMVEFPEATASMIANITNLTRATTAKIMNNLQFQGIAKKSIVPSIGNLGAELIVILRCFHNSNKNAEDTGNFLKDKNAVLFAIGKDDETIAICGYRDYAEFDDSVKSIEKELGNKITGIKTFSFAIKNVNNATVDFLAITKRLLAD